MNKTALSRLILRKNPLISSNIGQRILASPVARAILVRFSGIGHRTDSIDKAILWLRRNRLNHEGITVSSRQRVPYPEVTGYTIPTLYEWGEKELARDLTLWLLKEQNEDGSFSAPDGTPYTFDTGQAVRGFLAALYDLPRVEKALTRACDWILAQVRQDGRLACPSTANSKWPDHDDRIHLYVLPLLVEAGLRLNKPEYIAASHRVLRYYKHRQGLLEFNMLSHFHAYVMEALVDLGEIDLARAGMEPIATLQRKDGSVPAYNNVSWVCPTGVAQYAVVWYKLGMRERADKALRYLEKIQRRNGGFRGSHGKGAKYFPKEEISWAVKFFLDAHYWKIKTKFNEECVKLFPDSIDANDGRLQEILSFLGNLNGKRIIDVGCGKGRFLRALKRRFPTSHLYGLDISEKMLSYCPDGTETICGNILDIRLPDDSFDCVYCVEALEHAVRIESAVREMVRLLKPGGKIIIIDKNIAKLGQMELEPWERWFSPREIIELLRRYGVQARHKLIAYENHVQPDGLFIAWEGVKVTKIQLGSGVDLGKRQFLIEALKNPHSILRFLRWRLVNSRGRFSALIRKFFHLKPILPYVELHLTDHCNLNCKGCSHFSPIADEWFADADEHARDMRQLSRLFADIELISLLGGEPLLHPNITAFLSSTRECFPKSTIRMVTNGILLPKMPQEFWESCKRNSIRIDLAVYPPFKQKEEFWIKLAKSKGVKIYASKRSSFYAEINGKGDSDVENGFKQCRTRFYCPMLRQGKLYTCALPALVHYFNRRYSTEIPSEGYVDIYAQNLTGWDVKEVLDKGSSTCCYCTVGWDPIPSFSWSTSKRIMTEWDAATQINSKK